MIFDKCNLPDAAIMKQQNKLLFHDNGIRCRK